MRIGWPRFTMAYEEEYMGSTIRCVEQISVESLSLIHHPEDLLLATALRLKREVEVGVEKARKSGPIGDLP